MRRLVRQLASPLRTGRRLVRAGFTMVELIVAVALSVIVVAGLYGLFNVQSRQFVFQDVQMSMHQNMRFAVDILARSVRMAGYGTGGGARGPMGWDGVSASDASILPAVISWDGGTTGTDAITLIYADPQLEMNTSILTVEPCTTSSLTFDMNMQNYSDLIGSYSAGELVICWDYAPTAGPISYMWSLSGDGDSSTGQLSVTNNSGVYTDFDALCGATDNLPPVLNCSRATVVSFYIDDDDADGAGPGSADHPVLMMDLDFDFPVSGPADDDIPLVDDIEDLQIAYCNANLDCSLDASWTDNLTAAEGQTVWMARISVISRTPREDPRDIYTDTRPGLENRTAGSTDDGYYREVMVSEVTIRNLRYLAI